MNTQKAVFRLSTVGERKKCFHVKQRAEGRLNMGENRGEITYTEELASDILTIVKNLNEYEDADAYAYVGLLTKTINKALEITNEKPEKRG